MRVGRISKMLAVATATLLALGACTVATPEPQSSTTGPAVVVGGNVRVVEADAFTSFNPQSVSGATTTNLRVAYATHSGFNYVDSALKLVKNEQFGKYEKVSDDPLVVKYTINKGVQWSDGAPVTAADLMLEWAVRSGYFNDATLDANFTVVKGNAYFHSVGDSSGLSHTELPVIGDNGSSLTLTYTLPFSDWEQALGSIVSIPAHIVATRSGLKDADALTGLFKSMPKGDPLTPKVTNPVLKKVADFWNTGFDSKSMPDPSLALSNGAYLVKSITAQTQLVLSTNPDFTWGTKPKLDTVTLEYGQGAQAQILALKNQTADVVSPDLTEGNLAELTALKPAGIRVGVGLSLGFDQAVLNFKGSLFKPDLRTAFLKTIPRQEIVDQLAKPVHAGATVLDSFVFRPMETPFKESVKSNDSKNFGQVDTDGAKKLLSGATPTVRILYNTDDPVRVKEFSLISASAELAGFTITDAGKPADSWQASLKAGDFDVALYGWTANATGSALVPQVFKTGAASNLNNFSDPVVDELAGQLATNPDDAKQNALKMQIDKLVFDSGYGLPLFQRSGVVASGSHVSGILFSPVEVGVWWNVWDWKYVK